MVSLQEACGHVVMEVRRVPGRNVFSGGWAKTSEMRLLCSVCSRAVGLPASSTHYYEEHYRGNPILIQQ